MSLWRCFVQLLEEIQFLSEAFPFLAMPRSSRMRFIQFIVWIIHTGIFRFCFLSNFVIIIYFFSKLDSWPKFECVKFKIQMCRLIKTDMLPYSLKETTFPTCDKNTQQNHDKYFFQEKPTYQKRCFCMLSNQGRRNKFLSLTKL